MNYEKIADIFINDIEFTCVAYPGHAVKHLYSDGTTYEYTTSGQNFDMRGACRRGFEYGRDNGKVYALTLYQTGNTEMCLVVPSYYDYVGFYYEHQEDAVVNNWTSCIYNFNNVSTSISYNPDDYLGIGIQQVNQWTNFYNEYSYTYFDKPQAFDDGDTCVYDFTSLYDDDLYNVGNGLMLHNHGLAFEFSDWGEVIEFNFFLGSPYSYYRELGYTEGQSAGYTSGYNNGLQDGIAQGTAMSGQGVETATAFTYISGAFTAVSNVLNIEVLPHITLGVCFSIPLVIVLIMTIFKLVKK